LLYTSKLYTIKLELKVYKYIHNMYSTVQKDPEYMTDIYLAP
jgi:hypothetical protein